MPLTEKARVKSFLLSFLSCLFIIISGCTSKNHPVSSQQIKKSSPPPVEKPLLPDSLDHARSILLGTWTYTEPLGEASMKIIDISVNSPTMWSRGHFRNSLIPGLVLGLWNKITFEPGGTCHRYQAFPNDNGWGKDHPCKWVLISGKYADTGEKFWAAEIHSYGLPMLLSHSRTGKLFHVGGEVPLDFVLTDALHGDIQISPREYVFAFDDIYVLLLLPHNPEYRPDPNYIVDMGMYYDPDRIAQSGLRTVDREFTKTVSTIPDAFPY